jgi:tetratricopeptide (TPR) repeat protein
MDKNELKNTFFKAIRAAQATLEKMLDGLTNTQKKARGKLDAWSASDILNHIAFYNSHFINQIKAADKGERVLTADYYLILNDGIFIRNVEKDFEIARKEERESFEKGLAVLEKMDADELVDLEKYDFMNHNSTLDRALGTFGWHVSSHVSDFLIQNGELEKAIALQEALTEEYKRFPTWKGNAVYNLACFYSLQGMKEKALENLKIAFNERPTLIDWSRQDADMDPLRDDPGFQALTAEE